MSRRSRIGCALLLALAAVSCARSDDDAQTAASSDTAPTAETGAIAATTSGLCSKFTAKEIQDAIGTPVGQGQVAGPLGTACQWDGSTDDEAYAQIQVVGADYWSSPKLADGYQAVPGIAKEAFSVPELGGWQAGALTDTATVMVSVKSGSASRDGAVRLLREVLARL